MLIKSRDFGTGILFFLLCLSTSLVYADLMINPTRLVFEGRTRSGRLELLNNGTEDVTYRISLVNRRMNEDGKFSAIDTKDKDFKTEQGEHFADNMLVFSPPQVTLTPGSSQIIRIAWHRPGELADGEYRSHILFSQVPASNSSSSIETTQKGSDGKNITIKLTPLIGATIPIILRQGVLSVETTLTNLVFTPHKNEQEPTLGLVITRTGERSAYGDLVVNFVPCHSQDKTTFPSCVEKFAKNRDAPGKIELGRINGMAIYTPNALRRVTVNLKPPPTLDVSQGTLLAQFISPIEDGAKILSSEFLALP